MQWLREGIGQGWQRACVNQGASLSAEGIARGHKQIMFGLVIKLEKSASSGLSKALIWAADVYLSACSLSRWTFFPEFSVSCIQDKTN